MLWMASETNHEHRGIATSRGRTNAAAVLSFLASSLGRAYTSKEIHEATGLPRGSVGVVLSQLENRGLVRHRGEYWAIAVDEAVEKTLSSMRAAQVATDRFGQEDPDKWGPGIEANGEN